jgi:hypothetical protein
METGSLTMQLRLELSVLLPQPPEYWDYRGEPPHQLYVTFRLISSCENPYITRG